MYYFYLSKVSNHDLKFSVKAFNIILLENCIANFLNRNLEILYEEFIHASTNQKLNIIMQFLIYVKNKNERHQDVRIAVFIRF